MQDTDVVLDTGKAGKKFERVFMQGLQIAGLDFDTNIKSGALWDIHPKGEGWVNFVADKDVNIKLANTKWVFGSAEFSKIISWDKLGDENTAIKKVKRHLNKSGVANVVWLKPKDTEIQSQIGKLVAAKDKKGLTDIFIQDNFTMVKLGRSYDVRIVSTNGKVGSIVIEKGGKIFARSERPRKIGGSSEFVAFRTPTTRMSTINRNIKNESRAQQILELLIGVRS